MRHANWLVATAAGAGLSLLTVGGMAQLKTSPKPKEDADLPRSKVLGVSGDVDVPKTKGIAAEREAAKTRLGERREAADERRSEIEGRRETRRIPVIDANAGSSFRSTQLIGATVTDDEGRPIGKIVDFVVDARGNISYQVVSYFGTPGFTGKLFAIPFSGLRMSAGANNTMTAQFAFDPALLQKAPSFPSTRFPDFSDQVVLAELQTFFATVLADTSPVDPTLPANGPGDLPATVNPALPRTGTEPAATAASSRIPGTTGTENAGFPATAGAATRTGTSGSAAAGADLSGSIGSTRTGTTTKSGGSVAGKTGSPAGSSRPGGTVVGRTGAPASESIPGSAAGGKGGWMNPDLMVQTSKGVMHKDAAARLGLEGTPLPASRTTGWVGGGGGGWLNPDLMVQTSQGVMHKDAAARLGLEGTPLPKATAGGSRPTSAGTRTPDFRPIPPGGPASQPGAPTTGRTTAGGTRTPGFPSRPMPPGGPMPKAGGAGPRLPAPGSGAPGVPGVPGLPGGANPGVPGPAPGAPAPGGAGGAPGGGAPGGGAPRGAGASGS